MPGLPHPSQTLRSLLLYAGAVKHRFLWSQYQLLKVKIARAASLQLFFCMVNGYFDYFMLSHEYTMTALLRQQLPFLLSHPHFYPVPIMHLFSQQSICESQWHLSICLSILTTHIYIGNILLGYSVFLMCCYGS